VAAYGVVANISLVAVAIFNGVSQGSQPLISEYYGKGAGREVKTILRLAMLTSLALAVLILSVVWLGAEPITALFNNENDAALAAYAVTGLRLYFIGFLFAGINIVGTGILSAVESAKWAFAASVLRGFVFILIFAFLLSALFGMNGVWTAFPAAEFATMTVTVTGLVKSVVLLHSKA
jgi:Na+-driven multidrug efflux pump